MNRQSEKNDNDCPRRQIVAYLDGELSSREETELETHIKFCSVCCRALNYQKNLFNALGHALENDHGIIVPENFTDTVVANAESKVSGLRLKQERFRALFVCSALILVVLLLIGADAGTVLSGLGQFSDKLVAVAGFGIHLVHDFAVGIAVVSRSLCHRFIFSSAFSLFGLLVLFLLVAIAISRLGNRQSSA